MTLVRRLSHVRRRRSKWKRQLICLEGTWSCEVDWAGWQGRFSTLPHPCGVRVSSGYTRRRRRHRSLQSLQSVGRVGATGAGVTPATCPGTSQRVHQPFHRAGVFIAIGRPRPPSSLVWRGRSMPRARRRRAARQPPRRSPGLRGWSRTTNSSSSASAQVTK